METYFPLSVKIIHEKAARSAPYVAYAPELDISSAGPTQEKAVENLQEAIRLVLKGAAEDGTLKDLLLEAGFRIRGRKVEPPQTVLLPLQVSLP